MGYRKVVIGPCTLYLGDSLEVLPTLREQADAVITDPPYSSGALHTSGRQMAPSTKYVHRRASTQALAHNVDFSGDQLDQRSWTWWCTAWLKQCRRLLRPGGYMMSFIDRRQSPSLTDAMQAAGLTWRGTAVWDKTPLARGPHKGYFKHQAEFVQWASNGPLPAATHGGPWPGVITHSVRREPKLHMTGKPVPVMRHFAQCVPAGSLIVDPFLGSASTGMAALELGQRFIGIESSEHYFGVAVERIRAAVSEGKHRQPGAGEEAA